MTTPDTFTEDRETAAVAFADPVSYLRRFGIEAEFVDEDQTGLAPAA